MDFSNRDQALADARARAGNGWDAQAELMRRKRAEYEAKEAQIKAMNETQTKGRLLSTYTNPNENRTPGANYGDKTDDDLKKAFDETQANTTNQFQNNKGVVGPTGSEGNWFFNQFNVTTNPNYGQNQDFAANHDMQATDADLQAEGVDRKNSYSIANQISAAVGMSVLKWTGDSKKALKVTKGIFEAYGFSVRNDYYSGGGAAAP